MKYVKHESFINLPNIDESPAQAAAGGQEKSAKAREILARFF
jgi:hypothetical protein